MRTALFLLVFGVLALPAAALAKGPDYAEISGPGISGSIRVDGDGEGGTGTPLGALVAYGGFPSQVFGHHPKDPTTPAQPAGRLGARYRVVYSVPTPTGRRSLVADLYPYASPRPVTFMEPGQPFFQGMQTQGGWYIARPALKRTLGELGLPSLAPRGTRGWRWLGIGALAFACLAGVASALFLRRRPQSRPAPAS